jgi:hypothetical protein
MHAFWIDRHYALISGKKYSVELMPGTQSVRLAEEVKD